MDFLRKLVATVLRSYPEYATLPTVCEVRKGLFLGDRGIAETNIFVVHNGQQTQRHQKRSGLLAAPGGCSLETTIRPFLFSDGLTHAAITRQERINANANPTRRSLVTN